MKNFRLYSVLIALLFFSIAINAQDTFLPKWQKGYLDIHTISTGRGNCQYIIMPDGTTMMIDLGDFDGEAYNKKYAPLVCAPAMPDASISPARNVANYIKQVQVGQDTCIDYFFLTHFHSDHYGQVRESSPKAKLRDYYLTGITELPEYIPIKKVIDRGWPDYSYPINLIGRKDDKNQILDPTFDNYLRFLNYQRLHNGMQVEKLEVGSKQQISLKNESKSYPNFFVTNIKCNDKLWMGKDKEQRSLFSVEQLMGGKKNFSENQLSCAIVLQYGTFRYFAGGDNSGLVDQDHASWYDIETPMSNVVGKVSAMTLNHHSNRDATNLNFLNMLDPKIVIMQTWSSDHPGQEVGHRLISPNVGTHKRNIYMTHYIPLTGLGIGPWFERKLTAKNGHFLIRVYPDYSYRVYVLDNNDTKIKVIGISELFKD